MQKRKKGVGAKIGGGVSRALLHLAAGAMCGLLAAALLFSALAMLCCHIDIPPQALLPVSTAAISLAMLPAGLVFAMLRGERGLLYGLLMGTAFFAVLWIAALAQGQMEFTALAGIKGTAILCAGAIGGYLGVMLKERRRRIR